LNIPLKTKGLITKDDSGYIFVTFNTESSKSLISYSDEIRIAMRTPGYEDYMHYAYEPHTSVIKKDPLVLGAKMNSITDSLEDIIFTPKECIISRETKTEKGSVFNIIYTHQF